MRLVATIFSLTIAAVPASAKNPSRCCSEGALEYRQIMMPYQRAVDLAYRAGICQLRSEAYYRTLATSVVVFSMREASRIGISDTERSLADSDAQKILDTEAKQNGTQDILKTCDRLARDPKLLDLDELRREIIGPYH